MSGEFKESYIEKCVKARQEVEYLRTFKQRSPELNIPFALKEGDFFYYEWMGENFVKKARSIDHDSVFSEDGRAYPKYDCVWIPTRDQLLQEIESMPYALDDPSKLDEEEILQEYLKTHNSQAWNKDKKVWQKAE